MNQKLAFFKVFCAATIAISNTACVALHNQTLPGANRQTPTPSQATTEKIVRMSELNRYSKMKMATPSHTRYLLQVGEFSSVKYADQYKNYVEHLIQQPARVAPSRHVKGRYYVYAGPFNDVNSMVQAAHQLQAKKQLAKRHVVHATVPAHRIVTPLPLIPAPVAAKTVVKTTPVQYTKTKPVAVAHRATTTASKPVYRPTHVAAKSATVVPVVKQPTTVTVAQTPHVKTKPVVTSSVYTPKTVGWKDMNQKPLFVAGPYIGGSAGYWSAISGNPTWYKGIEGIVSAGWGHMFAPRFYLAGEFFAGDSISARNRTSTSSGHLISVRSGWSFGGDVIPGYMITDSVLGYLRGGVIRTELRDMHEDSTGWRVGAGLQTNIAQNLDLRVEYIFNLYQSLSYLGRQQADQANIGVVYKFPGLQG